MVKIDNSESTEERFFANINILNFACLLDWQVQDIFKYAFEHKYFRALNNLLLLKDFCNKIYLNEQNLTMIACAIVHESKHFECIELINNMLNNYYIFYKQDKFYRPNQAEVIKQLNYYIFLEANNKNYNKPFQIESQSSSNKTTLRRFSYYL